MDCNHFVLYLYDIFGNLTVVNVHVNGRVGASDSEIRDIAQKVAREINIQMNRTGTIRSGF